MARIWSQDKQTNTLLKNKVLLGMSGGVDSSVSAALLLEHGFDVTGGFIKNWTDTKDLWTGECAWRGERRDALRVAAQMGISLLTFDFEKEYRERVLARLFEGYERGITPNPDVLCNEEIKFGLFFEEAMRLGFDAVATGHYARVKNDRSGRAHLYMGVDVEKDQSYFLHRLNEETLRCVYFPVGELTKSAVRSLAESHHLPNATKPDSQGICFVGKLDFHDFLRKKIPATPGEIVTPEGEVVGHHDGLDAATIGQRQGLGVSKDRHAWYVAGKDRARNRLIVVPDREHPLLYRRELVVEDMRWIHPPKTATISVMTRYRQAPTRSMIVENDRSGGSASLTIMSLPNDRVRLLCDTPVWAPAPGQSAVIYDGDECLGGGVLAE